MGNKYRRSAALAPSDSLEVLTCVLSLVQDPGVDDAAPERAEEAPQIELGRWLSSSQILQRAAADGEAAREQ